MESCWTTRGSSFIEAAREIPTEVSIVLCIAIDEVHQHNVQESTSHMTDKYMYIE